jgi:hypothetical protein
MAGFFFVQKRDNPHQACRQAEIFSFAIPAGFYSDFMRQVIHTNGGNADVL